jgi:hypothetical protein
MSRFGDLLGGKKAAPAPAPAPAPEPVVEVTPEPVVEEVVEPVRARDENGHFVADDPSTPENEAWVGGEAPTRRKRKLRRSK